MKYKGRDKFGPNEQFIVIPRQEGNVVFRAKAVTDISEYTKSYPKPEPLIKQIPGKAPAPDTNDPKYKQLLTEWSRNLGNWIELKSLEATGPELTWDTVDMGNPETWKNWTEELKEAGFLVSEINKVVDLINKANGFDDSVYEEATESFLAGQSQAPQK
jgi:hypothetical protein